MFIKPDELIAAFKQYSVSLEDMQGAIVSNNPLAALWDIQQQGRITFADMRRRLQLNLDPDLSLNYLGCARKHLGSTLA